MKEFSAGGIIKKNDKVLLILMNTITGKKVWTFPKGHIEEYEEPKQAALREVFEETGIKCKITNDKVFYTSHYFFKRNSKIVEKKVYWYIMEVVEETGKILTPDEIIETRWVDYNTALKLLEYQSDKEMLEKLFSKSGGKDGA